MTSRTIYPCVLLALLCATPSLAADPQQPKWGASIDFEGKLGTQRHLGEADAIVPLWQDNDTLVFGNARFRMDDSNSMEGNFGLAVRHMLGTWNLGTYGYFDRRETGYSNDFNQLTFGAEALGVDFDVRANTYWPIGDTAKNVDSLSTASISGTSVIFRGGEERAMAGFDGEVGWRVPVFDFESPYDVRVYGGGFHFYDPDDAAPDVTGPRLRAELTAFEIPNLPKGTRVTLGTEWQNDDERGSAAFGSLRLRMPLQSDAQRNRELTAQERRMTTPIVRDIDIVAQGGAFGAPETATLANGQAITILTGDISGDGNLTDEFTTAGANATIIVSGTINTTGLSVMQSGQTLMGVGTLTVRSPSGRTATLATGGGTLAGATTNGTLQMAADTTVSGMTITNTVAGGSGEIWAMSTGQNAHNAVIRNNVITATVLDNQDVYGLGILSTHNITVTGNTISAVGTANPGQKAVGLYVSASPNSVTATIAGNTFNATNADTNEHIETNNHFGITILSGSTGNIIISGTCGGNGTTTGSISFTDGTTCP